MLFGDIFTLQEAENDPTCLHRLLSQLLVPDTVPGFSAEQNSCVNGSEKTLTALGLALDHSFGSRSVLLLHFADAQAVREVSRRLCMASENQGPCLSFDVENHWAWYRPYDQDDGWYDTKQRKVASDPVYIVCGHSGQRFDDLIHSYGMFLDTGYTLKTAALIEGDQVQLFMTPCDEVKECENDIMDIFADHNGSKQLICLSLGE